MSSPLAPEEIEKRNSSSYQDKQGRVVNAAFGQGNEYWEKLKARAEPGDTFYFASSKEEGQMYVLIRGGCIVGTIVTFISDWR